METFISAIIGGLGTGSVYALLGVGFVIIYRATDVINFAWYDPDALSVVLARYTLLGALYTAVVGVIMVFIVERVAGLRLTD